MGFMNLSAETCLTTASPVRISNSSNFISSRVSRADKPGLLLDGRSTAERHAPAAQPDSVERVVILAIAEGAVQRTGPVVARSSVRRASWDV
jgi:hypothetical protein